MKHLPRIAEVLHTGAWAILPEVHSTLCEQFRLHCLAGGAEPPETAARIVEPAAAPQGRADDEVGPKWRNPETGESGRWLPRWKSAASSTACPAELIPWTSPTTKTPPPPIPAAPAADAPHGAFLSHLDRQNDETLSPNCRGP